MTATANETATEKNTNTEPERIIPPAENLTDILRLILEQLKGQHSTATNALAGISAAEGDGVGKLLEELRNNSDDPEVKKLRDRVEKAHQVILDATNKMDEILRPQLKVPSESEVEALKAVVKDQTHNFKLGSEMFNNTAKTMGLNITVSDYLEPIPGMRKTSKQSQSAEGVRRPRVKSVEIAKGINPGDGDWKKVAGEDGKSTFSHLVKFFKDETKETVQTTDLHEAWFKHAGTTDFNAIAEVSTFGYSVKGEQYTVRITK